MLGAETRATGRATWESLLQAAVDCIAELGCVASTTTRIAKRAGVSRGSLQHHFRSRDDLLLSVAERVFISDPAADVEALRAKPLQDRLDHLFDHVERATLNNRFAAAVRLAAALDMDSDLGKKVRSIRESARRSNRGNRELMFADIDLDREDWQAIVRTISAMMYDAAYQGETKKRHFDRADYDRRVKHQKSMLLLYLSSLQRGAN